MRPSTDRPPTVRRVPVIEAASILGLTPDAVRSRLRRGTLPKEVGEDGTVFVRLNGDGRDGRTDQSTDRPTDQPTVTYINALRSENELLRRELEDRKEESRRKDHIIMTLAQRVPELEAAQEPREPSQTVAEDAAGVAESRPATEGPQEAPEARSWWRRWFGFE
jgi:hypothetical protein